MIAMVIDAEIQIGERTHHHDHAMKPVSFKVMKTMVSRPTKPMPPVLEEDELDIADSLVDSMELGGGAGGVVPASGRYLGVPRTENLFRQ